jgi:hypothetical protein
LSRDRLFAATLVALLGSGACFTPSASAPSPDASTEPEDAGDASLPIVEAAVEASADGGADATHPTDAAMEATAPVDAAVDGATDATPDSPPFNCGAWDAEVEVEASANDAPSINDEGGAPLPGPPPAVCSLTGDMPSPIEVINDAPCPIDVWWVDYTCGEQFFSTVDPNGGTWFNDTWETHPWRIRQTGSEQLLVEIPPVPEGADASLRTIVYP